MQARSGPGSGCGPSSPATRPHESNYSRNGRRIFHASIGRVYTPIDYPELGPVPVGGVHDAVKANRWLQIVNNGTFQIKRRWDMGKELAEAGYPGMSSAVRPMALTPDEKTAFLQVSFLHGIVEFDLKAVDPTGGGDYASGSKAEPATGVVKRVIQLPVSAKAAATPREDYVLDSAHHGIAINRRGTRLCVAGTMSDYAAIVSRRTGRPTILPGQARFLAGRTYSKPYWATTSHTDGNCWVSMSGSDLVTVISYRTKKVVAEVPVGRHPQRVRDGSGRPAGAAAPGPTVAPRRCRTSIRSRRPRRSCRPRRTGWRPRSRRSRRTRDAREPQPDRLGLVAVCRWSGVGALAVVGGLLLATAALASGLAHGDLLVVSISRVSQVGGPPLKSSSCPAGTHASRSTFSGDARFTGYPVNLDQPACS